jgi:hypothetical protein
LKKRILQKTQINPSTSASAITAFPAQPEMIVERFVEYAIAATKPTYEMTGKVDKL